MCTWGEKKTGHGYQINERVSIYQLVRVLRQTDSPAVMTRCLRFFFWIAARCELEASMTDESQPPSWNIFTFGNMPNVSDCEGNQRGDVHQAMAVRDLSQFCSLHLPNHNQLQKKKNYTGVKEKEGAQVGTGQTLKKKIKITARGRWFVNWLTNFICHPSQLPRVLCVWRADGQITYNIFRIYTIKNLPSLL